MNSKFLHFLIVIILLFATGCERNKKEKSISATQTGEQKRAYFKLMLGGSTFGLTGMFYYFSVQYLPVAVCVVLLMQSTVY